VLVKDPKRKRTPGVDEFGSVWTIRVVGGFGKNWQGDENLRTLLLRNKVGMSEYLNPPSSRRVASVFQGSALSLSVAPSL
jgi:hypothetical protein